MSFIYFGTPDFSGAFLEKLFLGGMVPRAVVTNPDRPVGRKKIITAPPVKVVTEQWNKEHGDAIDIFQPEKLDSDFIGKLKSFEPDFFVVFAYNKIFRKNFLEIPRLGTIGVHPSFLPKYRGASPFQTALLNGETETGVTLYLLDEGVDSGPILERSQPVSIEDNDTFITLAQKLANMGADLLLHTVPDFLDGKITMKAQDETQATFTKKFKSEDGFVEPADLASALHGDGRMARMLDRKIRALNPEPGVWTLQDGKRLKLLEAKIENDALRLTITQKEGEKPKKVVSR